MVLFFPKEKALITKFSLNQLPEYISVFIIWEAGTQHVSAFMIGQPPSA